jgi:hypothetical protein
VEVKLEIPSARGHERLIPMGDHWISKEEGRYVERRQRYPRPRQTVDDWIDQSPFPVYAKDWLPAIAPNSTGKWTNSFYFSRFELRLRLLYLVNFFTLELISILLFFLLSGA